MGSWVGLRYSPTYWGFDSIYIRTMLENPNIQTNRIQFRMLHENSSSRTTKFTNNSHCNHWSHFLFATFIHCVYIFTNGWFSSKTSLHHWGPKDAPPPPPKHPTQVRRGLVNANFHEHGHTLHSLTSPGIGFPSTGRKSPPQLCQPVLNGVK